MKEDGFKENAPEPEAMPEGYLNNLEDDHWDKLYKVWDAYFSVCDRAKGTKEQQESGFVEDFGVDTKGAEKQKGGILGARKAINNSGVEKDDDAKAAAQARAEEANMEKLLSTYGPEALRNTFWGLCKRDHPDITMLRFLRARKWDVDQTTAMLASTFKWRLDTNLDSLLQNGDLGNGKEIPKYIENFDENGKVFSLGTSFKQQPVMYVQFAKHIIWAQPQATTKKFIIAHFELVRLLVVPPNDKIVLLFDCTGFGPSNLDVFNFLYILQCLQSYFPETLAVLYLHKAPWILQQAWHAVKWLLDPVVRAKVQFTNHADELMKIIPREHLLKYIGGDVDVNFNWVPPEEGENDLHNDKAERKKRWDNHRRLCNQFEQVTRQWAASKGQEGKEEREILSKKLRLSHFDYEPYWLGSWVHHRNGDLPTKNPGVVRWEYPMKDGEKVRELFGREYSRKAVLRELQEIAAGAPVEFVENRTKELCKEGKFGDWDSCDDLPAPPTGFQNGQLVYEDQDKEAAALVDVIGLSGPETIAEAKEMAKRGEKPTSQSKPEPKAIAPAPAVEQKAEAPKPMVNGDALKQQQAPQVPANQPVVIQSSGLAPRHPLETKGGPPKQQPRSSSQPQKIERSNFDYAQRAPKKSGFLQKLKSFVAPP